MFVQASLFLYKYFLFIKEACLWMKGWGSRGKWVSVEACRLLCCVLCVCSYVCLYVCLKLCLHVCLYVWLYVYFLCVFVCVLVCVCVFVCVSLCTCNSIILIKLLFVCMIFFKYLNYPFVIYVLCHDIALLLLFFDILFHTSQIYDL